MNEKIRWFLLSWKHSAAVTALCFLVPLSAFYYWAGMFFPDEIHENFDTLAQLHGLGLLLVLVPTYVFSAFIVAHRRTLEVAAEIDTEFGVDLVSRINLFRARSLLVAMVLGFLYAYTFNIPQSFLEIPGYDRTQIALLFGQLLIWMSAFPLLWQRILISNEFNEMGKVVPIDLFEQSRYRPFVRVGLINVLLIAIGLVLTSVQSLDATFRWYQYLWAFIILLPGIFASPIQPIYAIHVRMKAWKAEELQRLNERIRASSKSLETDAMLELEQLLQRRERVNDLSTWPIDMSLAQRFLLYVVIPPLAWVGAAFVEVWLTS